MSHWRARLNKGAKSALLILTLCALAPDMAIAAPTRLTYKVYAGGVNAIDVDLNLDLKKTSYSANLSAYTRGFLGKLVPWRGSFASGGTTTSKTPSLQVREHKSISTWRGEDDIATYTYTPSGNLKSLKLTDNGVDKSPKELDATLTSQTTDILTATLNMLATSDQSKKCDATSDIFDSRRRFTLKFSDGETDTLKQSRYTFYQGPAHKCTVEVIPKGGAWHKKPRGWLSIQEQGRKQGALPTLWIAKIRDDLPPMPIKIMIKTDYGTMFMHLSDIQK